MKTSWAIGYHLPARSLLAPKFWFTSTNGPSASFCRRVRKRLRKHANGAKNMKKKLRAMNSSFKNCILFFAGSRGNVASYRPPKEGGLLRLTLVVAGPVAVVRSASDRRAVIRTNIFTLSDERAARDETTEAPPPIQASQLNVCAGTKAKTTITKM